MRRCGKSWRDLDTTEIFSVTMGVKQGCVVAPTLFISFFAAMIEYTLSDSSDSMYLRTCTDGGIFNLARVRAKTNVREHMIRDLLFADDFDLFAHTEAALNRLMISVVKTEVMQCITVPNDATAMKPPLTTVGDQTLKVVKQFKYLGRVILQDGKIGDITNRIARAIQSFR